MKKDLTTSVYTFEKLINGNFLYIDKTKYIYDIVRPDTGIYFLSRPRRFGKSLTLSTFKAIFQGKKKLFKGLYIHNKPFEWKEYPVIHLSLNKISSQNPAEIEKKLCYMIDDQGDIYGIKTVRTDAASKFDELITKLSKIDKVVILIDEYDKPLLDNINNIQERENIKNTLKSFYSIIKAAEENIRFVFMTGVSKFSKVSVFSELNNLDDLTMNSKYCTALGFTEEEVEKYFEERIAEIADERGKTKEKITERMKELYNGYRFSENKTTVYNPVSLTKFIIDGKFKQYWFETGTPSFLLKLLKEKNYFNRRGL